MNWDLPLPKRHGPWRFNSRSAAALMPRRKSHVMGQEMNSSFRSWASYRIALREIPHKVSHRATAISSPEAELGYVKGRSGATMTRMLEWYEVVGMGVGGMVGAGIFVTTGSVARNTAGPAVILSYLVAGMTALLSAICYTEFAVELPVAGGAFSYLKITLGEFAAFITGANLIMEYVVSNAAVARTFLPFLVSSFSSDSANQWRFKVPMGYHTSEHLDFVALALVLVVMICLCYSTKHSAVFNLMVTMIHLIVLLLIIVVGFAKGDAINLREPANETHHGGIAPFGIAGILKGSAVVYFSYIGYDSVSTMAEEVKDPATTMPLGVSGSVVIVTILYTLTAAAMCLMQPYDEIDPESPFSDFFMQLKGWEWASALVGGGASLGIVTSLMVAMFGQARYLCVIGRSRLVPAWFAKVDPRFGTPVNSTIFLGVCTAALGLLADVDVLLSMVSIGTLFVFYMVGNAFIVHQHVSHKRQNLVPTLILLVLLSLCGLCIVLLQAFFPLHLLWFSGLGLSFFIAAVIMFYTVLIKGRPRKGKVSLMTAIAAISLILNLLLLGSLDRAAYIRFLIWSVVAIFSYLLYGVHATYDAAVASGELVAFVALDNFPLEVGEKYVDEEMIPMSPD